VSIGRILITTERISFVRFVRNFVLSMSSQRGLARN